MLTVYNNNTRIEISEEDLKKAKQLISQIIDSFSFFRKRLDDGAAMNDVHTHMGLFESYFGELSGLVDYDSVLIEEANERYKEIRKANEKIRELESQMGQEVSASGIKAKLREYDNIVRCFYGALGIRYVSLEQYTQFGVIYKFTPELEYKPDDGSSGEKELSKLFIQRFSLITSEDTEWDIYRDSYHAELLDTDANRKRITDFMDAIFPDNIIYQFSSRRNDFGSYSLYFTVMLTYEDIEKLGSSIRNQM